MFHSKLLCAVLLLLIAMSVRAQGMVNVPLGAPLPNFQPNTNYNFAPGYQLPPGFGLPSNLIGNVGISVGGSAISATVGLQQAICPTCSAGQDAARAAAASGGAPNFQFQAPPLDGLNVNILGGGVALPADVGTQTLIQSGSSLMIGSPPPAIGGGGGKSADDKGKIEETSGEGDASGSVSAHASTESNSSSKDTNRNEADKTRPSETASPGKDSPVSPSASVTPAGSGRPAADKGKSEEAHGRSDLSGSVSTTASPASKPGDRDAGKNESEKARPSETASLGNNSAGGTSTSSGTGAVLPASTPSATGGGSGASPEKTATKDSMPAPIEGKPSEPRVPESPQPPIRGVDPVVPGGGPKPTDPRLVAPDPTGRPRVVVATPDDLRSRDSVADRIDQGLERSVGFTPPVDHRIEGSGIAVPDCMGASREGMACD